MKLSPICNKSRSTAVRLGMLAAALIATAAQADETRPALVLTIYTNGTAGADLAAGNYDTVLEQLAAPAAVHPDAAQATNLCVAYVVQQKFDEARGACDAAVHSERLQFVDLPSWDLGARRNYDEQVAIAYANRAVLDRLMDDKQGAERDLAAAAAYAPHADCVQRNRAAIDSINSTVAQVKAADHS